MQVKLRETLTLPLLPERERHAAKDAPAGMTGPPLAGPGGLGCDVAHAKQSKANNNKYINLL